MVIMDFTDKVVLISGATGGIGHELARQLSPEGCKLALFARREKQLQDLAQQCTTNTTTCIYTSCDVKKPDEVQDAVDLTVKTFGRIDVAILCAGILVPNPIETFDSTIIKQSIDINFLGYVYFIEALLPVMKRQQGGIIAATSTLPDRRGVPGWGAYGASKAAVSWLMESLRAEAKQKYNIDMITIKPGSVLTPMIEEYHRRGAISPEKAATVILNGIRKQKRVIQFPLFQVIPVRLSDLFPPFAYDGQDIELLKGDGYPVVEEKK
jgi:short-subunit dehydrogenase